MVMLANQRREKIIELLREDGSTRVINFAKLFKVSEVTIRQDLEKLEADDLIVREHGIAFLKNVENYARNYSLTNQDNMDKKELIGKKAADLIENGDIIILDSGSTTSEIARNLQTRKNLTILTNALNIAIMLGSVPGIEVIMTGGEFKAPTLSLSGQKAADFFSDIHVDKLFLATAGISLKAGLDYPSISDLVVKKAMIDAATTVYLVADSTKIRKPSFASLEALSLINYIVTDPYIKEEDKKLFLSHDIELIIA